MYGGMKDVILTGKYLMSEAALKRVKFGARSGTRLPVHSAAPAAKHRHRPALLQLNHPPFSKQRLLTLTIRHGLLCSTLAQPSLAFLSLPCLALPFCDNHPPRNPRLSLAVSHDQTATVRG